jgi:hypothetical protein
MNAAYISALAALAGTAIGGLTSFATSYMTQLAQSKAQRLAAEKYKREDLFGRFLDEAAKLYSNALQNKCDDASALMVLYGLCNLVGAGGSTAPTPWRGSSWTPTSRRT